jgi:valyl-tRNA synthetase
MDEEARSKFYPTSVLVTAPDIIFFWVARMIIAGLEFKPGKSERVEDNIPFRDVFFTGLIRDKQGRKMSKSLGNSPDPLDLIDKYGADGLRFGLMRIAPSGQDIRFDEKQIEEGRNFATKLWNAARFRQMHGPSAAEPKIDNKQLSIFAIEVLARLNETIDAIETAYGEYQFNTVAQRLYDFVWNDYCDWFVEAAKTDIFAEDEARKKSALAVMDFVLSAVLRLLHPFIPHITEELWSLLGFGMESIQLVSPPEKIVLDDVDLAAKRSDVFAAYGFVARLRNLRANYKIPSNKKVRAVYHHMNRGTSDENWATLSRLSGIESIDFAHEYHPSKGEPVEHPPFGGKIFLPLAADPVAERERLDKEIARVEGELRTVEGKLKNKLFVERAPKPVVEEHRRRQKDFSEQLAKLQAARDGLN